jgi:hypothetical protein
MKKWFVLLLLLLATTVNAQHQELSEKSAMYKGKKEDALDSTSLLSAFKRGQINGHFRYFFMSTQNQSGLSDFYANAVGGGLRYETARFHGFQFAVSGFYTFNIGSSDFSKVDDSTGLGNRYEVALFDVENPENKKDIDRLEELYIKYNYKKSSVTFGRQLLNNPFVNLQDGRMRPTGVEGIWLVSDQLKKTNIQAGWLYAISPRATTKWFDVGESIGVFSTGVDENGYKSGYKENINSNGILLLGIKHQVHKNVSIIAWDMLVKNVMHTQLLQTDVQVAGTHHDQWYASAQLVTQQAIKDGGNPDPAKTFIRKGSRAFTFGAKTGYKNKRLDASINYNRITTKGRYLMPREWGRDLFFTFLPRERNEGSGDVHAVVLKLVYELPKQRVTTSFSGGYFDMPDVLNYRFNKYGLPSYTQLNTDVRYRFDGVMKGMEAQLLWVLKGKVGETYNNKKFEFNKVDMSNFNLVLNYHF